MRPALKFLFGWLPAVLMVAAVAYAFLFYREPLEEWFLLRRTKAASSDDAALKQVGPFAIGASIIPDPPRKGENVLVLAVRDDHRNPIEGASVKVAATMPAMGAMPEMRSAAAVREQEPGVYKASFDLSMEGNWNVPVEVLTADGRHAHLTFGIMTGSDGLTFESSEGVGAETTDSDEIAYYTCSMHPSVRSAEPGTCPICSMDLTPVTRGEVESGMILVDSQRRQLIGVKTAPAVIQPLAKTIRTVGRIEYDETRIQDVTLKFRGWIGELHADATGKEVKKGETLFTIYSPELFSAQQEYLEAFRQAKEAPERGVRLLDAGRSRLQLWDISDESIRQLEQQGKPFEYLPFESPASGVITEKNIFRGSSVEPGMLLFRIADLSQVWIDADVYEADLAVVETGQKVEVSLSYLPDQVFEGKVAYIYPYLNEQTRTGKIRIELQNPKGALKPGMFADVVLQRELGERLVVPESAVIHSGENRVVFVDRGEGRLEPRRIKTGHQTANEIEVLDGLKPGDVVVTSANFLIAAESKLKAAVDKW